MFILQLTCTDVSVTDNVCQCISVEEGEQEVPNYPFIQLHKNHIFKGCNIGQIVNEEIGKMTANVYMMKYYKSLQTNPVKYEFAAIYKTSSWAH